MLLKHYIFFRNEETMQFKEKENPLPFMQHCILWLEGDGIFRTIYDTVLGSKWREELAKRLRKRKDEEGDYELKGKKQ